MNLLKLIGWELDRVKKMYGLLLGVLMTIQFGWLAVFIWRNTVLNEEYRREGQSLLVVFHSYLMSTPYILSIGIGLIVMLVFSGWIWYREFWGRGTFMMRLLTLPTKRIQLFISKFITVMMMILGLIAVQWFALVIEYQIFTTWLDGQGIRQQDTFADIRQLDVFSLLYPTSFVNFIIHVMLIAFVVLTVFTFVLVERSLWQRTIFSPLVSIALIGGVLAIPSTIFYVIEQYLFMDELALILVIGFLFSVATLTIIARQYLQKKISV
ncbi:MULTISPECIES: hypothetical protein [unclassified Exiguobacterium]|uniref:hypothetical protein n=2 Tax=Exiguobacterium TaxID=33986 RepID=UPI00103AA18D|nr:MULTISPECIES: hypothetical protein [unclassified Exiguobacterium]TCI69357.1 hypothetical protein EVJ22_10790 [Exiguobacterium sp. SH0S7]